MYLYKFLVDYRDRHNIDQEYESMVFNNDCSDNGMISEEVCNDSVRPTGRRSGVDEAYRVKGLHFRDKFRQAIYNHDIHRPKQT